MTDGFGLHKDEIVEVLLQGRWVAGLQKDNKNRVKCRWNATKARKKLLQPAAEKTPG